MTKGLNYYIDKILTSYNTHLKDHSNIVIGLSGGIDSVFLLYILAQIRLQIPITISAIHINHGISPNADNWEDFCKTICKNFDVPIQISKYTVTKKGGESLENNARIIRYHAFENIENKVLALAHHRDDQIETLLTQLFRGSDIHNLASMRAITKSKNSANNILYWRPLLDITKNEIKDIVNLHQLPHIEDESNTDVRYLRNFIRHNVLPMLTEWDNNISMKLSHLITNLQSTSKLLDDVAEDDFNYVKKQDHHSILVDKFKTLSTERQINVLCYYIHSHGISLPSHSKIKEFVRQAITSKWDANPSLSLGQYHKIIKHKSVIACISIKKLSL